MSIVQYLFDNIGSSPAGSRRVRRIVPPGVHSAIVAVEPRQLLSASFPTGPEAEALSPDVLPPPTQEQMDQAAAAFVADAAPFPLSQTFQLHSKPGATKRIYLDFNGHTTFDPLWNDGISFATPAFTLDASSGFSTLEKETIQKMWQRVAEDFLPFNVDVTTENPGVNALRNTGGGDTQWGIRVVVGGDGGWFGSAGGVAYLTSFDWSTDTPCFVFSEAFGAGDQNVAEAISHETGHSLGLDHDGTSTVEYYTGHGSGATSWAPIMGVAYNRSVSQWSLGQYADANNQENDLKIITTTNGFGFRPDDHGSKKATATTLPHPGNAFESDGIIGRRADLDFFKITVPAGTIEFDVNPAERGGNLDIKAALLNSAGTVLKASNPVNSLSAHISHTVAAGTYYIRIDGVGKGTASNGYTDYASLGYYSISGTVGGALHLAGEASDVTPLLAKSAAPAATTAPATWADWLRQRFGTRSA